MELNDRNAKFLAQVTAAPLATSTSERLNSFRMSKAFWVVTSVELLPPIVVMARRLKTSEKAQPKAIQKKSSTPGSVSIIIGI